MLGLQKVTKYYRESPYTLNLDSPIVIIVHNHNIITQTWKLTLVQYCAYTVDIYLYFLNNHLLFTDLGLKDSILHL